MNEILSQNKRLKLYLFIFFIVLTCTACQPAKYTFKNAMVYQIIVDGKNLYVTSFSKTIVLSRYIKKEVLKELKLSKGFFFSDLPSSKHSRGYERASVKGSFFSDLRYTNNNGKSWSSSNSKTPFDIKKKISKKPLPNIITVKHPTKENVLYRVIKKERVEKSINKGKSWSTVWKRPFGRKTFISRYRWIDHKGPPEMGPFDIAFTPDKSGTLIVTMGTEGILIMTPKGKWNQYAVDDVTPPPLYTLNLRTIFLELIPQEILSLTLFYLILSIFINRYSWKIFKDKFEKPAVYTQEQNSLRGIRGTYYFFIFSFIIPVTLFLFFAVIQNYINKNYDIIFVIIFLLTLIFIGVAWLIFFLVELIKILLPRYNKKKKDFKFVGHILIFIATLILPYILLTFIEIAEKLISQQEYINPAFIQVIFFKIGLIAGFSYYFLSTGFINWHTWSKIIKELEEKEKATQVRNIAIYMPTGTFFIPLIILILWTFGVIPWYELALVMAILAVITIWVIGSKKLKEYRFIK